ncbi:unnamed protein product [Calypogeia fissa]
MANEDDPEWLARSVRQRNQNRRQRFFYGRQDRPIPVSTRPRSERPRLRRGQPIHQDEDRPPPNTSANEQIEDPPPTNTPYVTSERIEDPPTLIPSVPEEQARPDPAHGLQLGENEIVWQGPIYERFSWMQPHVPPLGSIHPHASRGGVYVSGYDESYSFPTRSTPLVTCPSAFTRLFNDTRAVEHDLRPGSPGREELEAMDDPQPARGELPVTPVHNPSHQNDSYPVAPVHNAHYQNDPYPLTPVYDANYQNDPYPVTPVHNGNFHNEPYPVTVPVHNPDDQIEYPVTPVHNVNYQNGPYPVTPVYNPNYENEFPLTPVHNVNYQNEYPVKPVHNVNYQNEYPVTPVYNPNYENEYPLTPVHNPNDQNEYLLTPVHNPTYPNYPVTPVYNSNYQNGWPEDEFPNMEIDPAIDSGGNFYDNNNLPSDASPRETDFSQEPPASPSGSGFARHTGTHLGHGHGQRDINARRPRLCGFKFSVDDEDVVFGDLGLKPGFGTQMLDVIISEQDIFMRDARDLAKTSSHVRFNTGSLVCAERVGDMVLRLGDVTIDPNSGRAAFEYFALMELFELTDVRQWEKTSSRMIPMAKLDFLTPWPWLGGADSYMSLLGRSHSPQYPNMESCVLLRKKSGGEHDHDCQKLDWYSAETRARVREGDLLLRFGVQNLEGDPARPEWPQVLACAEVYRFTHFFDPSPSPGWIFEGRDECWLRGYHDVGFDGTFRMIIQHDQERWVLAP